MLKKDRIITLIISVVLTTVLTSLAIRGTERTFDLTASLTQPPIEDSGPCPQDMVFVESEDGGFCVDRYENSPGPGCPFENPQNQDQTRANLDDTDCQPLSQQGKKPWRNLSQDQALLACAKAGKRLPTHQEWYQAALGTPDKEVSWSAKDCHVATNWPSQPGLTGSGADCVSSAGAYDMIGNVWEWTKGAISDGLLEGRKLPETGYIISTDGYGFPGLTTSTAPDPNYNEDYFWVNPTKIRAIMRGGYWGNGSDAGVYSAYLVVPPSFSGTGVGFRCVK